jgi:hypothetical protein
MGHEQNFNFCTPVFEPTDGQKGSMNKILIFSITKIKNGTILTFFFVAIAEELTLFSEMSCFSSLLSQISSS